MATLWREYRSTILFIVLMLGFRSAWADWVYVPSGSRNPTILEGDRLMVDKRAYGLRIPLTHWRLTAGQDPARGDIAIFDGTTLVKRVIAVPGDSVALEGEQLIVNGVPARYSAGETSRLRELLASTQLHHPVVLQEAGVGRSHEILLLPDRSARGLLGPITVPAAMYFVLGDNRDNSADSRYIGFVPRANFIGRATTVAVSLDPERYYLPRKNRVWVQLH
jgi:signal peptidase I